MLTNAIRRRVAYPAAVANAPQLTHVEAFYYQAFIDLNTCRNYEGASIPWTAVNRYAEVYSLDPDTAEMFEEIIRRVDEWLKDYMKAKADGGTKSPNVSKPKRGVKPIRK